MELQVNQDMELRKLSSAPLCRIADILETNSDWKKVMSLITKNPLDGNSGLKYNNEHMRLIEEHAKATGKKCAEILFDEWGTSGRVRPTLRTLKEVVKKAEVYRAVDVIAEILNEPPPPRPTKGPAAPVTGITILLNNINMEEHNTIGPNKHHNYYNQNQYGTNINNDTTVQMLSSSNIPVVIESIGNKSTVKMESAPDMIQFSKTEESINIPDISALIPKSTTQSDSNLSIPVLNIRKSPDLSKIDNTIMKNSDLVHFEYKDLEIITYSFYDQLFTSQFGPTGRIGSGGFGEVYVGYHPNYGQIAVKRFRDLYVAQKPDVVVKAFNSEVKSLLHLRHANIVPIIGYSIDGPSLCLICEYIEGGSLEQNLAAKRLNEGQREAIMMGTAEGLKYIHQTEKLVESEEKISTGSDQTMKKNYYMHGDVKSANILLTKDCVPKLCDFGLAKHIDQTVFTTTLMGTCAYMAPEGFSGTVTQKIDIYSYGIVLLELLTGLKPIVADVKLNIKDYVEENCTDGEVGNVLDPVVNDWKSASEVYELARKCLQRERNDRPSMEAVCDILRNNICNY